MLGYINDVLLNGYTKKDAYLKNINGDIKQPSLAVVNMEKRKDFQEIYQSIISDDQLQMNGKIKKVQSKYVDLIEKNLDTAAGILDEVAKTSGEDSLKNKAIAVRLVNETVGAMGIVQGPAQATPPGKLNKAGAVL